MDKFRKTELSELNKVKTSQRMGDLKLGLEVQMQWAC